MKTTNVRSNDTVLMALAREMTDATVTAASSGNNTIVAAPGAGKRLAFAYVKVQRTQGVTAETVVLYKKGASGDTFAYSVTSDDIPGEVLVDAVSELQLRVLPENTAFVVNLSGANSQTFTLRYLTLLAD
jgi:hypothetical protein